MTKVIVPQVIVPQMKGPGSEHLGDGGAEGCDC